MLLWRPLAFQWSVHMSIRVTDVIQGMNCSDALVVMTLRCSHPPSKTNPVPAKIEAKLLWAQMTSGTIKRDHWFYFCSQRPKRDAVVAHAVMIYLSNALINTSFYTRHREDGIMTKTLNCSSLQPLRLNSISQSVFREVVRLFVN